MVSGQLPQDKYPLDKYPPGFYPPDKYPLKTASLSSSQSNGMWHFMFLNPSRAIIYLNHASYSNNLYSSLISNAGHIEHPS